MDMVVIDASGTEVQVSAWVEEETCTLEHCIHVGTGCGLFKGRSHHVEEINELDLMDEIWRELHFTIIGVVGYCPGLVLGPIYLPPTLPKPWTHTSQRPKRLSQVSCPRGWGDVSSRKSPIRAEPGSPRRKSNSGVQRIQGCPCKLKRVWLCLTWAISTLLPNGHFLPLPIGSPSMMNADWSKSHTCSSALRTSSS